MNVQDFSRTKALNNIPSKKVDDIISAIKNSNLTDTNKSFKIIAINRYSESNIPIEYWNLKMERDFKGDPRLLNKYVEYIKDLQKSYIDGKSLCLAGSHGVGKSMVATNILKRACEKGYFCLYSTLSDIVSVTTQASGEDRFLSKRELCLVDFLVVDEFDSRFMANDNAADLYARSLENVFRTRSQNRLPTIMCTNSPNILESLNGSLKNSISSLMKGYMEFFPVFGSDFRQNLRQE